MYSIPFFRSEKPGVHPPGELFSAEWHILLTAPISYLTKSDQQTLSAGRTAVVFAAMSGINETPGSFF